MIVQMPKLQPKKRPPWVTPGLKAATPTKTTKKSPTEVLEDQTIVKKFPALVLEDKTMESVKKSTAQDEKTGEKKEEGAVAQEVKGRPGSLTNYSRYMS